MVRLSILMLVLLGTGCATLHTYETARVLPAGKHRVTGAIAAPLWNGTQFVAERPSDAGDLNATPMTYNSLEAPLLRVSTGLGHRLQVNYGLSLGAVGLNGGLKWQILGDADSRFALAALGEASIVGGGFSLERIVIGGAQADLIATWRVAPRLQLSMAPRIATATYWRKDAYNDAFEDEVMTDRASAYGVTLGAHIPLSDYGRLGMEFLVLRVQPHGLNTNGGTRYSLGVAYQFDPTSLNWR